MALDDQGRDKAQTDFWARTLPVDVETHASIATSERFGPFPKGAWVCVAIDANAHVNVGDNTVTATASNPKLTAGVHDFVMPIEGYVALFGNGAGEGCAWEMK